MSGQVEESWNIRVVVRGERSKGRMGVMEKIGSCKREGVKVSGQVGESWKIRGVVRGRESMRVSREGSPAVRVTGVAS